MSSLDNGNSCATLLLTRHGRMYLLFKSTQTLIYVALRFVGISDTYPPTSVVRQKIEKP